ncbi:MAG: hypothetical protein KGJ84_13855 [Elusimicrobia bacterium]|nr:hypothetical protein [Elusimicrobiota bacterium]
MTPKYMVGRIVSGFPHTPNGLRSALPAINILYPGSAVTRDYGDKVDIPCVGVIDMIVNSGGAEYPDSGDSWSWQVVQDKCGACKPNQCEAVSKSAKCGAASPGASGGSASNGGGSSGGGSRSGGGSSSGGGGGRSHPDRSDVVAQAKADLETAGHDLTGACGAFAIVRVAAWRMRDEGAGLLSKPSGNNCEGYATDIIAYPDGRIYDVLVGGGESNGPAWQDDGTVDPGRYTTPEDPGL